ncbi:hypothetical protein Aperf_G00000098565 [Anoplocephala perfoliata]
MPKEKDMFALDQEVIGEIAEVVNEVEINGVFRDEQITASPNFNIVRPPYASSKNGIEMVGADEYENALANANTATDRSATLVNLTKLTPNPVLDEKLRSAMQRTVRRLKGRQTRMNVMRRNLPAFAKKQKFLNLVDKNQVVVVVGETGSGKTTQLPQYLLEHTTLRGRGSRTRILVTQPRRISAISVAERVASERGQRLGEDVGYQIRFEKVLPKHFSGSILFCTTGIVLQFFLSEPLLQSVSHIFVDEVHEREMMGDILMTMLKRILPQRPDLRVILMSATLNSDKFRKFFDDCPILKIPGRTFHVEPLFLEDVLRETGLGMSAEELQRFNKFKHLGPATSVSEDIRQEFEEWVEKESQSLSPGSRGFLEALGVDRSPSPRFIAEVVDYIAQNYEPGAILVFIPGIADIQDVMMELKSIDPAFYGSGAEAGAVLYPLHSSLATRHQRKVFLPVPEGKRKIVIATNIAETSITIEDIVYVVDSGAIKITTYNPSTNTSMLSPVLVSRSNATQRKGRAGRVREGICFHLFSTFCYERVMRDYLPPEITRVRLEDVILRLKALRLSVTDFLFSCLDPPDPELITRSFQYLLDIGALAPVPDSPMNTPTSNSIEADDSEVSSETSGSFIEEENYMLTPLGYHLAYFLLPPQCTKLILLGALFCCLEPALAIAACLTIKDPFEVLVEQEGRAVEKHRELAGDTQSDHWAFYLAIRDFRSTKGMKRWGYCSDNFLDFFAIHDICGLMEYFAWLLYVRGFIKSGNIDDPAMNRYSQNTDLFRAIIAGAFCPNYIMANPKGGIRGGIKCSGPTEGETIILHKNSVNAQARLDSTAWFAYFRKMKFGYQAPSTLMDTTVLDGRHVAFFSSKFMLDNTGLLKLDDWITLSLNPGVARLIEKLKHCFDLLLNHKMRHPSPTNWNPTTIEGRVMQAVVKFFLNKAPEKRGPRRRQRRRGGGGGR